MASRTAQSNQIVDLVNFTVQQLGSVKKQLDDEVEHLTASYTKLLAAQLRFRECLKSIKQGVSSCVIASLAGEGKPMLIPMTSSLYVPGTLADSEGVIVDVGTGFYVEKSTQDALKFYVEKVNDLSVNLKDLETILQGKSSNLRTIEDVLRQKMANASGISPGT